MQHPPAAEWAAKKQARFHSDIVEEVKAAVDGHDIVVVGMTINPNVGRARKALDAAGLTHHYVGYGGYLGQWKQRLAIKLWSQWPTFPQVFVKGTLIGGADQTVGMLEDGSLKALLEQSTTT